MKKIVRIAALSVMALSLTGGVAAAHSGTIVETGPDSYNKVEFENWSRTRVRNDNNVGVGNVNLQLARSGNARSSHNTTGGNATSGAVRNDSMTTTNVGINNSGSSAAALSGNGGGSHTARIENTGPDSFNKVEVHDHSSKKVRNTNNVGVLNLSVQAAGSGSATVSGNTTGGNATSGAVTNVNTTTTTVNVTN